ncbi:MAG: plasmid recombination protein [Lachnospiraceae bacterium]|nr:plasmid recombination protein [Lachnospiraceae bacterium]
MAKNMSVARVNRLSSANIGKAERHNERKNKSYENMNVDLERTPMNVVFADTGGLTYNDHLQKMIAAGEVSTRGLKKDACLFDEMIIDVNTDYFETHGGYEYAKQFYEEAFHFTQELFGERNIVSAVMHADEINKALTEKYGYPVYHYHLHVIALPVVEKEILWSKRCKDESLRGTVKEVIQQISHSKKWASDTPVLDEQGQPVLKANGQPLYRKSYSILQDKLYEYLTDKGFRDFERGVPGSTAEHLTSLEYQIKKDYERLEDISKKIEIETISYEQNHQDYRSYAEIDTLGQKKLGGRYSLTQEDYKSLTELAKEGIASRSVIKKLQGENSRLRRDISILRGRVERLTDKVAELRELCKPYLDAMERFPDLVKEFFAKLSRVPEKTKTMEHKAPAIMPKKKERDGWSR